MPISLNHIIVWSSDPAHSSRFLATILGLPPPVRFGHFEVVQLDNDVTLDFAVSQAPIQSQHLAFLIGEDDFDPILGRIRAQGLGYWADPMRTRPGEIIAMMADRAFILRTLTTILGFS